MIYLNL